MFLPLSSHETYVVAGYNLLKWREIRKEIGFISERTDFNSRY